MWGDHPEHGCTYDILRISAGIQPRSMALHSSLAPTLRFALPAYPERRGIHVMERPARPAELNAIKHLWDIYFP